jgi:hypothetical protein
MMSSFRGACSSLGHSPFWCLDNKGEKIVIFIIFFILVCNGQVVCVVVVIWTRTYLCVACKTLMACITLYNIVPIMLSLYVWMSFMIIYFI